ncbi:hypothetical protein Lepto7375DRAFT_7312 [Leptolyngbya sp. PCC 7375]|nr:hypothetical protein Lepto7375DRAFT_7312 [Leptolyngbya sp. PCC 7375]
MPEPFSEDEILNNHFHFKDVNSSSKFEIFKSRLQQLACTDLPFNEWKFITSYYEEEEYMAGEISCLCTHGERCTDVIKHFNYLSNRFNHDGKVIRVGSRCIKKLPEIAPDAIIFSSINNPKIKGISKDAIIRAYELGFINEFEYGFAPNANKRTSLSDKQHIVLAKIRAQISLLVAPIAKKHLENFAKLHRPKWIKLVDVYGKSIHKLAKRNVHSRLIRHFCNMLTDYFLYLRLDDVDIELSPQNTKHLISIFRA